MKKIIIAVSVVILIFNAYFVNRNVYAFAFAPVAAPAGITISAGVYVSGALVAATLAGAAGYDTYEEDINAHAKRVWDTASQAAKNSLTASIKTAYALGKSAIEIPADFYAHAKSEMAYALDAAMNPTPSGMATSVGTNQWRVNTGYTAMIYNMSTNVVIDYAGPLLVSCGAGTGRMACDVGGYKLYSEYGGPTYTSVPGSLLSALSLVTNYQNGQLGRVFITSNNVANIGDVDAGMGSIFEWSGSTDTPVINLPHYNSFPAADVATGAPARYNPTTEQWENVKTGINIPSDNVLVNSPSIGIEKGNVIARDVDRIADSIAAGKSTSIVTGQPIAVTPDGIPIAGTGTNVNIATGEAITVAAPAVPPDWIKGDPSKIDWTPLTRLGPLLTQQFPLSIPWDFYRFFKMFAVEAKTPNFSISVDKPIKFGSGESAYNTHIKFNFPVDLSFFNPIATISRWFLLAVFDIWLILALRRITPD